MKKRRRKLRAGFIRDIFITLGLIAITTASICAVVFTRYITNEIVPKADVDIAGLTTNLTSVVYYQDSNTGNYIELETLHGEQNRIWTELSDIPDYLKTAFISIEDERFYDHSGVDWKRTLGAVVNWVLPMGGSYGGSTITQQLIKNVTQDNDFKVTRKITEILRALDLESKLEKDEILEMYLNTIYFGRTAYGVNTASSTYFGKDLDELNLAECAVLAGLTNNPSLYDPFRYPENVKKRQTTILNKMYELKHITKDEYEEALAYELKYVYEVTDEIVYSSQSYFIDALIEDVVADLMSEKGYSKQVATQLVYTSGLKIYATVDPTIQTAMETVYENESNFPNISGANGVLPQSAMVVMDPQNGMVLGIVGGRGEKVGDRILNRATQSYRQPGSTMKPIAVYAPAIDAGLVTPITVFDDSPYDFESTDKGWPKNYYTGYNGRTTVTQAMLNSVNTVAVKTLDLLGTKESYNFLTANLGVTTLQSDDANLSPLALGGLTKGMSVLELTAAYVPFANEGVYYEPILYTKVLDAGGNVLLENEVESTPVFNDPDTVFYMRDLLRTVVTSGTGSGTKISGMDTIGKTGTTDSVSDLWFAGATPYYVAATWFGYDAPQTISQSNSAKTLWTAVMSEIHKGLESKSFAKSSAFTSISFCLDSGLKATEYCKMDIRGTRVSTASMNPADMPKEECNMHVPVLIDMSTGGIANEYCPEDSIEEKIYLDLTRLFEKDVYLPDEQYTFMLVNDAIGEGIPALRIESEDMIAFFTGHICEEHNEETWLEDEFISGLLADGYYFDEEGNLMPPFIEDFEHYEPYEPNNDYTDVPDDDVIIKPDDEEDDELEENDSESTEE